MQTVTIEIDRDIIVDAVARKLGALPTVLRDDRVTSVREADALLTIHNNAPHTLELLPGSFEGNWKEAQAWAKEQGGELPSRIDQLVLFKNLKSEFKKAAYWSGEPCAGNDDYAWYQYFSNGTQYSYYKDTKLLARAVRRFPI